MGGVVTAKSGCDKTTVSDFPVMSTSDCSLIGPKRTSHSDWSVLVGVVHFGQSREREEVSFRHWELAKLSVTAMENMGCSELGTGVSSNLYMYL